MTDPLDGRIGEAWSGEVPNGSHINVVLARRGSPTAAAAAAALAGPRPGIVPFLACLSPGARRAADRRSSSTSRRSPTSPDTGSGRSRGARRSSGSRRACWTRSPRASIPAAEAADVIVLVARLGRPGGRRRDGGQAGEPRGDARRDRRRAATADGRGDASRWPSGARRRRTSTTPAISRPLVKIASLEVRRYGVALDPPLRAAWDPEPRTRSEAALAIVRADDGTAGYASGDELPDAALLERLLVGIDPRRTEVVRELCETVDFHGGRPWIAEVAVWDLVGRALGEPLWRLLGGRSERILAYASSAEPVAPEERARRVAELRDAGVRAVKLRFHHADWREDVAVVEAVRDAVGGDVELMVDANQGWRMAGDRAPRWDVATAIQCARALEPLDVYWLEEPLPTGDVDGYARLRAGTSLRIAAGEMVRSPAEARDLVVRGGVDVVQPDAVLAGGIGGCRRIAALGRPVRAHVLAAHLVQRPRAAREPPSRARRLDLPVAGGAARPARLDGGAARLAARRRRWSRSRRTAPSLRPPGLGSARRPTSTRSRRIASHEDPRGRPARLPHAARGLRARARAARPRRGARARRRRRGLPLGPAPGGGAPGRGTPPDRPRARGRRPGRGRRGGRDPRRARRSRRVLLRPGVRRVPGVPRGPPQPLRGGGARTAAAGTLLDGTSRLRFAGRAAGAALHLRLLLRGAVRRARRDRPCRSQPSFRCGRPRC